MTNAKKREYASKEIEHFVRQLEELVKRRTKQWKKGSGPGGRKGTWTELYEHSSYLREVRRGRRKSSPPNRADIMALASFMFCESAELRQLLLAAGWYYETPHVSDELYDQTIEQGRAILHQLSMPAFIVTRTLHIAWWNPYVLTLFGLTQDQALAVPDDKRNILYFIFDPELLLRPRWEKSLRDWNYTARLNIQLFKRANVLSQYDDWYREFEDRVKHSGLPDFQRIWDEVKVDVDNYAEGFNAPIGDYVTRLPTLSGDSMYIRGLMIRYTEYSFPRIIGYVPEDEETALLFSHMGLPTPDKWST